MTESKFSLLPKNLEQAEIRVIVIKSKPYSVPGHVRDSLFGRRPPFRADGALSPVLKTCMELRRSSKLRLGIMVF
jgi:hypothetical protein